MLRAGLIGLPSTGKTSLFTLLSRRSSNNTSGRLGRAEANLGSAEVPDERLDRLTEMFEPEKRVAATVVFSDIVGTTGPQSLIDVAAYREANALLHVVRAFNAEEVPHAAGNIDPIRDVRNMEDELILADLSVTERRLERLAHDMKKGTVKSAEHEARLLSECREALENGTPIRSLQLEPEANNLLRGFQFLSAKPLLLLINLDEADIKKSNRAMELTKLTEILSHASITAVPVCAKIELEIAQLEAEDAQVFLADLGLKETGLTRVVRAAYELLGYISFFTVGEDECRAWSIPMGTIARDAAGEIHTDIQHGFIRAEVVSYENLTARGSMNECRDHGEVRLEGKNYVVRDGDVINFRFAK